MHVKHTSNLLHTGLVDQPKHADQNGSDPFVKRQSRQHEFEFAE